MVNSLVFKIANGGAIIKEEDYKKIFEKFYRTKDANVNGHGVGLSIVKKIVELHNGSISVTSKDGVTEFVVTLPTNN